MKCEKCNEEKTEKNVPPIRKDEDAEVCLKCEPFWNQPCGICRVKRVFCCC